MCQRETEKDFEDIWLQSFSVADQIGLELMNSKSPLSPVSCEVWVEQTTQMLSWTEIERISDSENTLYLVMQGFPPIAWCRSFGTCAQFVSSIVCMGQGGRQGQSVAMQPHMHSICGALEVLTPSHRSQD